MVTVEGLVQPGALDGDRDLGALVALEQANRLLHGQVDRRLTLDLRR